MGKSGILIILPVLIWAFLSLAQGRTVETLQNVELSTVHQFNRTYPLTVPSKVSNGTKYRIALISDLDKKSKKGKEWISYLQKGYLTYNPTGKTASVQWDKEPIRMSSKYSYDGRGMELSELVVFNGKLLAVDDRTGVIFELDDLHNELHPWVILSDGDGHSPKGLKAEWATVKDETLYVGSNGDAYKQEHQWVKTVSKTGEVKHFNWTNNYDTLLHAQQIKAPGYSKYESGVWSPVNKRWYFLPKKSSKQPFDPETDERSGTNVLLSADPDFSKITVTRVGEIVPTRAYTSVKFISGTNDTTMVALKVKEVGDETATYITVFTTSGEIFLPDIKVSDHKYEGIEFV